MTDTFLLNDFYTSENQTLLSDGKISATILFNANHPIFKGHFEQMPVVPGVCQTQLIKEILQEEIKKNLILSKGPFTNYETQQGERGGKHLCCYIKK